MNINVKSDFDFILDLRVKDETGAVVRLGFPPCDFSISIYNESQPSMRQYVAECVGGRCTNCVNDDGRLRIICDNHGLALGELAAEVSLKQPNSMYPDGTKLTVIPMHLDIRLVEDAGDYGSGAVTTVAIPVLLANAQDMIDDFDYLKSHAAYANRMNVFTSRQLFSQQASFSDGLVAEGDVVLNQRTYLQGIGGYNGYTDGRHGSMDLRSYLLALEDRVKALEASGGQGEYDEYGEYGEPGGIVARDALGRFPGSLTGEYASCVIGWNGSPNREDEVIGLYPVGQIPEEMIVVGIVLDIDGRGRGVAVAPCMGYDRAGAQQPLVAQAVNGLPSGFCTNHGDELRRGLASDFDAISDFGEGGINGLDSLLSHVPMNARYKAEIASNAPYWTDETDMIARIENGHFTLVQAGAGQQAQTRVFFSFSLA